MKIKVSLIASIFTLVIVGASLAGGVDAQLIVSKLDQSKLEGDLFQYNPFSGAFQPPYNENSSNSTIELYINEVMADNDITIEGPGNDYPDWIEIYNASDEEIDLSGMYLTEDLLRPIMWIFPQGTTIEPEGYLVIWADGRMDDDGLHVPFRLNANGDSVALFDKDGVTLIDSITFHKQIRDTSFGRTPDGGDEWSYMSTPTPGSTNEADGENDNPWTVPVAIVISSLLMVSLIALIEHRRSNE